MTRFSDLVNRAWMHAKSGPLYLAGYSPNGAVFSEEPTAYTEAFIAHAEAVTGYVFERVLLSDREQLEHERLAIANAYRIIEAKDFWSDDDRRRWRDLVLGHAALRKAIAQMDEDGA